MPFRSSRRVTNRRDDRSDAAMAMGEPPSHSAQTSSPAVITAVLAALASSFEPMRARASPAVPKPGVTTASISLSKRRLGVSANFASSVTRPSRTLKARIRPSPSNQCVALPPGRRNLPGPLRNSVPSSPVGTRPCTSRMARGATSTSRSAVASAQSALACMAAIARTVSGVTMVADRAATPINMFRRDRCIWNPQDGAVAASSSEPVIPAQAGTRGKRQASQRMTMVWAVAPETSNRARSQLAGPMLPTALLEKA